jgi:predicted signal transduction protein with EAL and GGDEF domain
MLLDMLTDRRLPEFLANRLLVALREPMPIDGELVAVGASIGIAHGGGDYTSIEQIRRDADLAMYEAKGAGRDRIVTFTDALGSDVRRRMALERELRKRSARTSSCCSTSRSSALAIPRICSASKP